MSFVNLKDTYKEDIVNTILAQNTTIVAVTLLIQKSFSNLMIPMYSLLISSSL